MGLVTLQALQLASWPSWEPGLSGKMPKELEHQQAPDGETCRLSQTCTAPSSHNKNILSPPINIASIVELAALNGTVIKQFSHMQNKW